MSQFLTVMEIVAPVFILGAIGYSWVRLGHEYRLEFVTTLAMTLSTPCLIFTALMKSDIDPAALTELSAAAIVGYLALTLVMAALVYGTRLPVRSYLAPLIFGNTGNVGLPLALFAFGETGLSYAVVIFAVMAVWSFTFGVWVVSGGGSVLKVLREPIVAASLLGALFLWQGWQTPVFLTNALDLIGQIAIPIMLITLGVAVARLRPGRLGRAAWLSAAKYLICIALAWTIARLFGLDQVATAVMVMQFATPIAVTSYMLAEKYEADSDSVAGLVVVSTIMAVAVFPVLLAIFV
ncbi:MAG: AEC family transporter [Qingshengfaniella sp.]